MAMEAAKISVVETEAVTGEGLLEVKLEEEEEEVILKIKHHIFI